MKPRYNRCRFCRTKLDHKEIYGYQAVCRECKYAIQWVVELSQ